MNPRRAAGRMLRVVTRRRAVEPPRLSFGDWGRLDGKVVAICHPDWRGVRTATYGHRVPVVEVADPGRWSDRLVKRTVAAGVELIVVHGFPPGSDRLIRLAAQRGLDTRCVFHSSMTQHGGEDFEAANVDLAIRLLHEGSLGRLGFVKEGQAEAFGALGHAAWWVPNRLPPLPNVEPLDLGAGLRHVGVFAEPFWRKNVITQLGAVALMGRTRAHVIYRPRVAYLSGIDVVAHSLLPYQDFLRLQASVDLNLYVTLSECYPLSPLESYAYGVPCLVSRTSDVFRDDEQLWALTTTDEADNPVSIAQAAERLLDRREEAVKLAQAWTERWDELAANRWRQFVAT